MDKKEKSIYIVEPTENGKAIEIPEVKDFKKLYEDIVKSEWFKKAYHDKSLGDCPFVIDELEESEDTMDEFTRNIRNLIIDKLTVHTNGLDGSEISSTVFIDDKTAKDIASGVLFYVGKETTKNPNREIPEWSEEDENKIESIKGLITMGRFADTNTIRTIWNLLDSLRPSWKPSEEQMICPKCGEKMILDEGKVYTSIPPQYGYKCPKCGNYEYSTKKLKND